MRGSPVLGTEAPPEMVVIPAGTFTTGTDASAADRQQKPEHRVFLNTFAIDRTEVTVSNYKKCIAAGVCPKIKSGDPPYMSDAEWFATFKDDQPIREVSWHDANRYCTWVGKRLPTEAEWEKAARGPKGYINPWGNRAFRKGDAAVAGSGYSKVGSFPHDVSGYGVADMAGSVMEWVADWYSIDAYRNSAESNPQGPSTGTSRVVRGASWQTGVKGERRNSFFATTRFGDPPEAVSDVIGFRCAKSLDDAAK